jgi:16S rRNA (guanine527-N7)-methyltransferase
VSEDEARAWLAATFDVPRETWDKLERFVALLFEGMARQNLIAESTGDHVWARHIVDSAQLLTHAPAPGAASSWIDLGAGAGLPGIVIALLSGWPVTLIENRRMRIGFLEDVVAELALDAKVVGKKVEAVESSRPATIISARAYAPLDRLLSSAQHLGDKNTIWLLPKGRSGQNEVATIGKQWQGAFHVERSVTDVESVVVIATGVSRKGRR